MSATRPELGNTGREMLENTGPVPEVDHAWSNYLWALSWLLDPIADVTRPPDGSERWTVLASPTRCPDAWLPVLAQWAGVRRADNLTDEQLRDLIGPTAPGMWRGTRDGILAAVRRFLPEGAGLYWEEFADGNAYKFRVFTYNTPPEVEQEIREALAHAKPAGLFPFEYQVRVGQTWAQLRDDNRCWRAVRERYADWHDAYTSMPGDRPDADEYCDLPVVGPPPAEREITIGDIYGDGGAGTSTDMPETEPGDLLLMAVRTGNADVTPPAPGGSVPQWQVAMPASPNGGVGLLTCTAVATSSSHTSGVWQGATNLLVTRLRASDGSTPAIAPVESWAGDNQSTVFYNALTFDRPIAVGVRVGARSVGHDDFATPPEPQFDEATMFGWWNGASEGVPPRLVMHVLGGFAGAAETGESLAQGDVSMPTSAFWVTHTIAIG